MYTKNSIYEKDAIRETLLTELAGKQRRRKEHGDSNVQSNIAVVYRNMKGEIQMNKNKKIISLLLIMVMVFSQVAMVSAIEEDITTYGEPCGTAGCSGTTVTIQTGSSGETMNDTRVCVHGAPTKTDVQYSWINYFTTTCRSCGVGVNFTRSGSRWDCNK